MHAGEDGRDFQKRGGGTLERREVEMPGDVEKGSIWCRGEVTRPCDGM